jgi:acetoin utilization deacetylase AcuC-like enzyme
MTIPVVFSDQFLIDYDTVDCESPQRASAIRAEIGEIARYIEAAPCTLEDLRHCHSDRLIARVAEDGELYGVAQRAAGAAIQAARLCCEQGPAFALIRPPGHHAGRDFNGGFCFFNNIAIAVTNLLAAGIVKNALIVDIDLHYGNGTHDIVRDDGRINFQNLSAFTREEFFGYFDTIMQDASGFDLVACSAGFDMYVHDWGGVLFTEDYRRIGASLARSCPKVFAVLEGGYYIPDLGTNVYAFLRGFLDVCS